MKKIESSCDYGTFHVCEREDYSLAIAVKPAGVNELREVGLFEVAVARTETVHILAQSEKDAISQAECVIKGGDILGNFNDKTPVSCVAKSIPFGIRGWGKALFDIQE